MKNPTTPDIYRMIRTATILAVSSQAQLSEAPGRGATRAGVVLRSLDRSAIVCQSPHRRIASRATTPPYHHSVVQQYSVMATSRLPGHIAGTSALPLASDIQMPMSAFRPISSASLPKADFQRGIWFGRAKRDRRSAESRFGSRRGRAGSSDRC